MKLKIILTTAFLLSILAISIGYLSNITEAKFSGYFIASPSDTVSEEQILVYNDKVVLDLENVRWATYENTSSMVPVLDEGANGLEIVPGDIKIGDIVSYEAYWKSSLIVHRVVDIGEDAFGTYYILKGDNNDEADPGKVRFSQIKYKTIAIIY